MNSKNNQKSELLQRMHDILDQRKTSNEHNFNRKCRLRDNLISFGEEFLTPEAFDRLVWILKDGGVDLLPMPQLRKPFREQNLSSGKNSVVSKVSSDLQSITRNLISVLKQVSECESSLQMGQNEEVQPLGDSRAEHDLRVLEFEDSVSERINPNSDEDSVSVQIQMIQKCPNQKYDFVDNPEPLKLPEQTLQTIKLPIETNLRFEQIERDVQRSRKLFNQAVNKFRSIYEQIGPEGGLGKVFDVIFGRHFVKYYHYIREEKRAINTNDGIRRSICEKFVIKKLLPHAFPEHDPADLNKELKQWFYKSRKYLMSSKCQPRESKRTDIMDAEPLEVPEVTFDSISLPIETDIRFEQFNRQIEMDRTFYDHVVNEFRDIYDRQYQNGGWKQIFDDIFGKKFVRFYHFARNQTKAVLTRDGIRRSIHEKFLIQKLIPDAFSDEDSEMVIKELKSWFQKRRHDYINHAPKGDPKTKLAKGKRRKNSNETDEAVATIVSPKRSKSAAENNEIYLEDSLDFANIVEIGER